MSLLFFVREICRHCYEHVEQPSESRKEDDHEGIVSSVYDLYHRRSVAGLSAC